MAGRRFFLGEVEREIYELESWGLPGFGKRPRRSTGR